MSVNYYTCKCLQVSGLLSKIKKLNRLYESFFVQLYIFNFLSLFKISVPPILNLDTHKQDFEVFYS